MHLQNVECDESCGKRNEGGTFSPVELISKKRDDGELSREEIESFISGYHSGLNLCTAISGSYTDIAAGTHPST